MQFQGQGKPPVGVIFDSDMGNRIESALALALLYGLDGKNEARVVSVSTSKSNLHSAAYCEAIGRFYAGAVSGGFGAFGRTLPVGMADDGKSADDTPMLTGPLSRQTPDGKPLYAHGIHKLNDTADVAPLIRNALTAQHDENAVIVLAGPATNLVRLFDLHGAMDWAVRKVRLLSVAIGSYPDGAPEPNIRADIAAAKRLFEQWPTPIVACGSEIGQQLLFPEASIEKDFAWSQAHPIVDSYRAYKPMPYDAPTPDLAAVLYAIRPKEGYFNLSGPGTISVTADGRTTFNPAAGGRHRYLILDPAQKDRIIKTYVEIASAKPVVRQRRFPSQDKKAEPPPKPPAEAKPQA
jgi:hypothetical protein